MSTTEKSGRILLRLPKSLHRALEIEAESEGVSLNSLAVAKLSLPLSHLKQVRSYGTTVRQS